MRLLSIKYSEFVGQPQQWDLAELTFGSKTLIVGRNAAGKSRTLNVINGLARQLAGLQEASLSGDYRCRLEHNGKIYLLEFAYADGAVQKEELTIDGKAYLTRGAGGVGTIHAEEVGGGTDIKFQAPTKELACVVRRDTIQHSYLEPLYQWASAVRLFQFGSQLGKDHIAIINPNAPLTDDRDQNAVLGLFRKAEKEFGAAFVDAVKADMLLIGYPIDQISTGSPVSIQFKGLPGEPMGLYVREKGLSGITDQYGMSQGMYRVLALLIHINWLELRRAATCLLIDDIGEGLDFDRSCRLIALLRRKAEQSDLQVILSTNDRFVMNNVPLEEWCVLQRKHSHVRALNYENSREKFDEFKYTGLSNFSFFELNFFDDVSTSVDSADA